MCSEQDHIPVVKNVAVNTNLTDDKIYKEKRKYASLLQRFRRLKKATREKDILIRNLRKENEEMSKKLEDLNIHKLESSHSEKAKMLLEQLMCFSKKKPHWSEGQ